MSYPDAGSDSRLIPGLGWLQKLLIIRGKAPESVKQGELFGWHVKYQKWPPFVLAEKQLSEKSWRQARIGWTWRKQQSYYIPGAAWKRESEPLPDYQP